MFHWPKHQTDNNIDPALRSLAEREMARMASEAEAARFETHRALDEKEEQIGAEMSRQSGLLQAAEAEQLEAEEQLTIATRRLEAARHKHELTRFEVSDLRGQLDNIQNQRRAASSPKLTAFISEMWKKFDEVRIKGSTEERMRRPNRITGKVTHFFVSNQRAIDRAIQQIRAAIEEAQSLQLRALSDVEIDKILDALRARIPEVVNQHEEIDLGALVNLNEAKPRYA
jgi:hypothetical protein